MNYHALAAADARRFGVPVQVFLRQINQESHFDPNARSPAGALGIAEFMPATAREYGVNPMDPVSALAGAARMDAKLMHEYGVAGGLSAYNSGNPNAYKNPRFAGGQTSNYVKSILGGRNVSMGSGGSVGSSVGSAVTGNPLLAQILASDNAIIGIGTPPSLAQTLSASVPQASNLRASGLAGGFLPAGASYKPGRIDQGHDFQTNPGGAIIAPGSGHVVRVGSDPNGFGPAYPIVHFDSGPYAGQTLYIGHTISALRAGQRFGAGTALSHTGTRPIGNASVPGWAEVGYAPGGSPGSFGQRPPF